MSNFKLEVSIGTKVLDLEKELEIKTEDLSGELAKQPGKFAYWAALKVQASLRYDELKAQHSAVIAEVSKEMRERALVAGLKKTEKQIEQEIPLDSRVRGAFDEMMAAKRTKDYLAVAVEAFDQRMHALQSIGAIERSLADGLDPTTRRRDYREESARALAETENCSRSEMMREIDGARKNLEEERRRLPVPVPLPFGKKKAFVG